MSRLELRKDRKTGEPVIKRLVSAEKAKNEDYLVIKAYDNKERETEQTDKGLRD